MQQQLSEQRRFSEQQISNLETQVCSVTTTTTTITATTITTTTITTTTITTTSTTTITTTIITTTITTTTIIITTTTMVLTTALLYTLLFKTLSTGKVSRFLDCVPKVVDQKLRYYAPTVLSRGGRGRKQVGLRILTFFLEDLCQKPCPGMTCLRHKTS